MKTLVLLALTTLHLCYILKVSTGATLSREMPASSNLELKDIIENGREIHRKHKFLLTTLCSPTVVRSRQNEDDVLVFICTYFSITCQCKFGARKIIVWNTSQDVGGIKDFAERLPLIVSEIRMKNNDAPRKDHFVENVKKDIGQFLSSPKAEEYYEKTPYKYDTVPKTVYHSSNVSVGLSCNWSGRSFKCCQSIELIGTTCLVAEAVSDEIKLSLQIGGDTVWEKTVSYKSSLESMLREASKQITENAAFDENMNLESFEPENMFDDEQSVILTEEEEAEAEATDEELSTVEDDRSTENVDSGIRCSWRGRTGHCCQTLIIIRYRIRICFSIYVISSKYMRLNLDLNGRRIFTRTVGVRIRRINVCLRKGHLRICFHLYGLHISRSYARVCLAFSARLGWILSGNSLGCVVKRLALDANPTITNKRGSFSVYKKHNDTLPSSGFEHNNNDLRFEHNNNVDRFEQ